MILANYIQDMSAEELFGIIKPFLYLVPGGEAWYNDLNIVIWRERL